MKLKLKFNLLIVLLIFIMIFENCSTRRKSNQIFPSDDTIPRTSEPKPKAVFYNGNFFQYFPAPPAKIPK